MRIRRTAAAVVALAASLLGAAVAPAGPAQAAPSTLFGSTTNGAYLSTYGPVDMYRAFFPGAPGSWSSDPKLTVSQPENVSFKYDPVEVTSGLHDAELRTFFGNAPTNRTIWWTFYHEPEDQIQNGIFTATEYLAAWRRIWSIAHEPAIYKSNLKATLVLMDWDLNPLSKRNWLNYYPGDAYVDVISWDVYNFQDTDTDHTNNETIAEHEARIPAYEKTIARGKQFAISEIGYRDTTDRAAFLSDLGIWARDHQLPFVAYFDSSVGADYRLTDSASQNAWKNVVNGSLFAGAVTATNNPATGVTSTSATMSCLVDPHNLSYRVTVASWLTVGGDFYETPGVTVADGPETVSHTRTGLTPNAEYTFRCKVYDGTGALVLKPATLAFTTLP